MGELSSKDLFSRWFCEIRRDKVKKTLAYVTIVPQFNLKSEKFLSIATIEKALALGNWSKRTGEPSPYLVDGLMR